jgi:hypothetical protein
MKLSIPEFAKPGVSVADKLFDIMRPGVDIKSLHSYKEGEECKPTVIIKAGSSHEIDIQIVTANAWRLSDTVELPLLDIFEHKSYSEFYERTYLHSEETMHFFHAIKIWRTGILYPCDSDILAYYISSPVDLLLLFNTECLEKNRKYYIDKCGIRLKKNEKVRGRGSAFVPVPKDDEMLNRCGVAYKGNMSYPIGGVVIMNSPPAEPGKRSVE